MYLTHPFLSFIFILSLSNPGGMPGVCRRSSVGKSVSQIMKMSLVQVQPSAPDVCYRIAAPWKGKTATRGLSVRCMKAAGRIIITWLAPAMNEETDATDIPAQG